MYDLVSIKKNIFYFNKNLNKRTELIHRKKILSYRKSAVHHTLFIFLRKISNTSKPNI